MKKAYSIVIAVVLLFVLISGGIPDLQANVSADTLEQPDPVAWWTFDDAENLGNDSSGNNNHLFGIGAPSAVAEGKYGGAVYLNGASAMTAQLGERGDFVDEIARTTGKITIGYWYKATREDVAAFNAATDWRRVISKGSDWGVTGGFVSINNPDDPANPTVFYSNTFCDYDTGAGDPGTPNVNPLVHQFTGDWTFIAFTIDTVAQATSYYINGELVCTYTREFNPLIITAHLNFSNLTRPLAFGASYRPDVGPEGDLLQPYIGSIDQACVYNSILTADQITYVMNNHPAADPDPTSTPTPTPDENVLGDLPLKAVAWWTFDDAKFLGKDSSGNNNHLVAAGGPKAITGGKFSGAVYLDGSSAMTSQLGETGDFIDKIYSDTGMMTLMYWYKVTKDDIQTFDTTDYWPWRRIVSKGCDWETKYVGGFTSINNPDSITSPTVFYSNTYCDYDTGAGDPGKPNVNPVANQFTGDWTFIAFTMDSVNNTTSYYINGELVCAYTGQHVPPVILGKINFSNLHRAFAFGANYSKNNGADVFSQSYTGSIDQAGVFDTVLTQEQIKFCMNNMQSGNPQTGEGSMTVTLYAAMFAAAAVLAALMLGKKARRTV